MLAVAYAAAGIGLLGDTAAVFCGDIGMKFVQIDNLAHGHAWLEYTGRAIDPAFRLYPYPRPFVFQQGAHIYSVFLNPVTYLGSAAYRVSGAWGCRLLTIACVLGVMAGTYKLTNRMDGRRSGAGAATLLLIATPLWFYGWVFWEHAPATLLCLAATLILTWATVKRGALAVIAAGVLLGVAVSCRPEALIYLGASAIALGVVRRSLGAPAALVTVALAVILPLAFATPGLSLGKHFSQNFAAASGTATAPLAFLRSHLLLVAGLIGGVFRPPPFSVPQLWGTATTFACLLVLAFGALPRFSGTIPETLGLLAVGLLGAAPSVLAFVDERTLMTGLLTVCPVAIVALANAIVALRRSAARSEAESGSPNRGLVGITAVAFTAGTLVLTLIDGGSQWGPRFLLPVFPLLACLLDSSDEGVEAKATRSRRQLRRVTAAVLIGASVVIQSVGAANHLHVQGEKAASLQRMTSLPGHCIVTDKWYLPQEAALATIRADKVVLLVSSGSDVQYAVQRLERMGVQAFAFVGSELPGKAPRQLGRYREAPDAHSMLDPFELHAYEFLGRDSLAAGDPGAGSAPGALRRP